MGTGSFPGLRRPGRDADHTLPSSAEVKKELSYTSIHPMGPPGPVTGFPLPLPLPLLLLTAIELSLGGSRNTLVQTKQRRINIHKRNKYGKRRNF
jgi:hypothetical protein